MDKNRNMNVDDLANMLCASINRNLPVWKKSDVKSSGHADSDYNEMEDVLKWAL